MKPKLLISLAVIILIPLVLIIGFIMGYIVVRFTRKKKVLENEHMDILQGHGSVCFNRSKSKQGQGKLIK